MLSASADAHDELPNNLPSPLGVRNLWMKLYAIERLGVMRDRRIGCGVRATDDVEMGRDLGQLVSVRHPHLYIAQLKLKLRSCGGMAHLQLISETLE